jgi:hypothetical protein
MNDEINQTTNSTPDITPMSLSTPHVVGSGSKLIVTFLILALPFIGGLVGYQLGVAQVPALVESKSVVMDFSTDESESEPDMELAPAATTSPRVVDEMGATTLADEATQNCFSEIPFTVYEVDRKGTNSLAEGFILWLPDDYVVQKPEESPYITSDYVIESPSGQTAEINLTFFRNEVLRSRFQHSPSIVYEPLSDLWWFESFFNNQPRKCIPNPTGFTKYGDPIYLTQDGDAGAFFKVFTVVANDNDRGGYADAFQVTLYGNSNDPDYDSYKSFETVIQEMLYNVQIAMTKG